VGQRGHSEARRGLGSVPGEEPGPGHRGFRQERRQFGQHRQNRVSRNLGAFHRDPHDRGEEETAQANGRTQLRGELQRGPLLPLPPDGRLRGVRLGLDYRPQEVRGELLLGRVSVRFPPKVPAHAFSSAGQPVGFRRALLRSPQNVLHIDAVL